MLPMVLLKHLISYLGMNRNLSLGYDQGQGKMEAHKFIKSQHNGNCQYSLLLSLYLTQTKNWIKRKLIQHQFKTFGAK